MCCFSQPVIDVSDTKIFARIAEHDWQYLVYQMEYETEERNAMILPLPVTLPATDEKTVEFISLEKHDRFFDDMEAGFPLLVSRSLDSNALTDSIMPTQSAPKLVVHEVGDFEASFVPSVNDFDRLDPRFRIPKESWAKIPGYENYGFAVFQLKELQGHPHPMAFKFRSRMATGSDAAVFFPTVHIHDGEVHAREDFDHSLYLQAKSFDGACGSYQMAPRLVKDSSTGYVRSKWRAKQFCNIESSLGIVDGESLVHRLDMRGKLKNTDVLAQLKLPQASRTSMSVPQLALPVVASAVGAAGIKWFFDRRDRLSREDQSE